MNYFNINSPEMSDEEALYVKYIRKIQNHLFNYPGRKNIGIHHSTVSNRALFYFRMFAFIFLTALYIWHIEVEQKSLFQNFMYLTMLGYLISWLYFGLCVQDYCLNIGSTPISKKLPQFIEIFHQISFCAQLPITLVFWGILFRIILGMEDITTQIIVVNGFLHSTPFIFLCIDLALNSFSFHINHVSIIIIFNILYAILNLVYTLEMKPIYAPIDWVTIGSYIVVISSVLLCVLAHYIGRIIYRKWKSTKLANAAEDAALLIPEGRRESVRSNQSLPALVQNNNL